MMWFAYVIVCAALCRCAHSHEQDRSPSYLGVSSHTIPLSLYLFCFAVLLVAQFRAAAGVHAAPLRRRAAFERRPSSGIVVRTMSLYRFETC